MIDFQKQMIVKYSPVYNLVNFDAKIKLHLNTVQVFERFADFCKAEIQKHTKGKRCFLMFNLDNLIIDPSLMEKTKEKINLIYEKYAYPYGAIGYGTSVSRVTVRASLKKLYSKEQYREQIFYSKKESLEYVKDYYQKLKVLIRQKQVSREVK